jgi:AcrR family transcriptional regulator
MATSSARSVTRRSRVDPEHVSAQILDAFTAKAKRIGLRALIMTELATELRMSASTLYKLYPSKESLALACVDRWADELAAAEAARSDSSDRKRTHDGFEHFMLWVDAWADANAGLSPAFTRDLRTDYPAVWRRYRQVIDQRKGEGASMLRPLLKPEVDERVAFALLDRTFSIVLDPAFADRLRVSRREALRSAVSIWAGGALARSERNAKVVRLRGPRGHGGQGGQTGRKTKR